MFFKTGDMRNEFFSNEITESQISITHVIASAFGAERFYKLHDGHEPYLTFVIATEYIQKCEWKPARITSTTKYKDFEKKVFESIIQFDSNKTISGFEIDIFSLLGQKIDENGIIRTLGKSITLFIPQNVESTVIKDPTINRFFKLRYSTAFLKHSNSFYYLGVDLVPTYKLNSIESRYAAFGVKPKLLQRGTYDSRYNQIELPTWEKPGTVLICIKQISNETVSQFKKEVEA